MDLQELVLLLKVHLRQVRWLEILGLDVTCLELVVNLLFFLVKKEFLGREGTSARLEGVLLVLLTHLDDALAVATSAQIEAVPVSRCQPVARVEPVTLGAGRTGHYVVDVDTKYGVDDKVKNQHFDAIHENVIVEF